MGHNSAAWPASHLFGQEHFCLWLFEPYLWDVFVLKISETNNYGMAFLSISPSGQRLHATQAHDQQTFVLFRGTIGRYICQSLQLRSLVIPHPSSEKS